MHPRFGNKQLELEREMCCSRRRDTYSYLKLQGFVCCAQAVAERGRGPGAPEQRGIPILSRRSFRFNGTIRQGHFVSTDQRNYSANAPVLPLFVHGKHIHRDCKNASAWHTVATPTVDKNMRGERNSLGRTLCHAYFPRACHNSTAAGSGSDRRSFPRHNTETNASIWYMGRVYRAPVEYA